MSAVPTRFDAVVVGSGFGGSVSAYRLARAGLSVCLLERGKPYPPGSFPRSPTELGRNFWDPSKGLYGMFDIWDFAHLEALVSSCLGGGSIIYANVFLRKDPNWFVHEDGEDWPVTRADLDPHYDAVEAIVQPHAYPFDVAPYSSTPKTQAMKAAADARNLQWELPKLTITFGNDPNAPVPGEPLDGPPNLHGARRYGCRLVGECNVGCNFGSKNSLDYNYLSRFVELGGADCRTLAEVKTFAPSPGGFTVDYVQHPGGETHTIRCSRLVLAAGAIGSTYLLLRNADSFPNLSRHRLGTQFSGNGDLLGFLSGARVRDKNGKSVPRILDPARGPVITSAIRYPDALDGGGAPPDARGHYVEDGGYPEFASWLLEGTGVSNELVRAVKFLAHRVHDKITHSPHSNLSAEISQFIGDGSLSGSALPLLSMGRERPAGRMHLRDRKWLALDWTAKSSESYYKSLSRSMREIGEALGATYKDNALWYFKRAVTVHPLGGCPMGKTPEQGVVDPFGQVFGCPGLSVADGAVMPGTVGPNPSFTIAALADRFADRTIETPAP
jgi:cholesterol oxidase